MKPKTVKLSKATADRVRLKANALLKKKGGK
jgi:hypothetical protein